MEKKLRILMVLLCLFLFPLRVFALEETIEVTNYNQSTDNVAVIEDTTNNVVESTDNEELPVENSNENQDEPSNTENSSLEENTSPVEENNTPVIIDKIVLENVNLDLIIGKLPEFSGRTLEADSFKYSLYYESWYEIDEQTFSYYYSLDSKNEECSQSGSLLDKINEDTTYHYEFAIQTKKNVEFKYVQNAYGMNVIPLVINGVEYECAASLEKELENGDAIFRIKPRFFCLGIYEDKEYLDSISFTDVNYNITVGKKPIYSGKVDPSLEGKIRLSSENWSYYSYQETGETDYFEYNYSNPEFLDEDMKTFETFEIGKNYDYMLLFQVEDGYALKTYYDAETPYHIVYVNGEKYWIPFYYINGYNGSDYYFVDTKYNVSPATENYNVIEGSNTTLNSTDDGVLKLKIDGEYNLFEHVYVDNKLIHDGYTVESGSTIITFTNAFLKSLGVGTHEVVITYSDGKSAYTTLTIQEVTTSSEDEEPNEDSTTKPVTPATSNVTYTSNSNTNVTVAPLADKEEYTDLEIAEDDKEDDEIEENKNEDEKKSDKPKKENSTKKNSTLYIILAIIILIIIAVSFVIVRKKD